MSLKTAQQLEGKFCLMSGEKLCRECWIHTKNIWRGHNSPTSSSISENVGILSFKRICEDEKISGQHSFFKPNKLPSFQIFKIM